MPRVLITGGTGTFGQAATARFLADGYTVTIFSRDEQKQELMAKRFPGARYFLGDVRDAKRLHLAMHNQDIIIHAAALKIVAKCELDPMEAVKTNVGGVQNLIDCALNSAGIKKVLFISTDKAVDPVNLYGATKKVAEHMIRTANNLRGAISPVFSVARYGNVWNSRGSVVERWLQVAERREPCLITSPLMTRFFMTVDEAVDLVARAFDEMAGGEIFLPKLKAYQLGDLRAAFKAVMPQANFKETGPGPGEKIHEALLSSHEVPYAFDGAGYSWIDFTKPPCGLGNKTRTSHNAARMTLPELVHMIKETIHG